MEGEEAPRLVDRGWYWVHYESLGVVLEAPAMYIEATACFYSYEFAGVPARHLSVLRPA